MSAVRFELVLVANFKTDLGGGFSKKNIFNLIKV